MERTNEKSVMACAELGTPARQQLTRRRHLGILLLQAKKRLGMRSGTNRDDRDVIGHRCFSSGIASADRFRRALSALDTSPIAVARVATSRSVQLALTLCRYRFLLSSKG